MLVTEYNNISRLGLKMDEKTHFSLQQAMAAQAALHQRLQLPPERFPLSALIGMLSDEIEMLRKAGISDEEIAKMIGNAVGTSIEPADISRHYATADRRAP